LYFSLLIISRNLTVENCVCVPFVTKIGRDTLVVDIPVFSPAKQTKSKEYIRLCTTHLESLWSGKAYHLS
jgi:tyrosyl-DNA phosphodiesterase 2